MRINKYIFKYTYISMVKNNNNGEKLNGNEIL